MSTPRKDHLTVSGPIISPGPTRKLRESVVSLLDRLDLSTKDHTGLGGVLLVLLTELMLLCGATGRILSLYASGQLDNMHEMFHTVWDLMIGGKRKGADIDFGLIKTIHMINATFIFVLLVPQLYILAVNADEQLTLVLQMVLALLVMVLTLFSQTLHTVLAQNMPDNKHCSERGTCLHSYMAWVLFVMIVVFLAVIFIRVLFNIRFKNLIAGFKIIGPLIEFCVSRRFKDFVSLNLILILIMTVLSGMILNTKQVFSTYVPEEMEAMTWEILLDLGSAMMCLTGLLSLVLIYCHNHIIFSHTKLVSEQRLNEELAILGERHKQVLMKDRVVSETKYCPVSRSARPVRSAQLFGTQ